MVKKKKVAPNIVLRNRRIVALTSLIIVLLLFGVLTAVLYNQLTEIGKTPEDFKAFIDTFGFAGWLVALGIQILQVLIALIPGELVEIGMGCAFGAVEGVLLCLVGVAIASTLVFLLTRRFGVRFLELFFSREKIDGLRFINSEKKLHRTVFILFFIPGTPKDLLTYFVGLTRMRLSHFLIISLIARIPSVASSVIGGNLISSRNYAAAAVLFAVTGGVSLLGMLLYDQLLRRKRFRDITKQTRCVIERFLQICAIPHGSGNTARLATYCLRFAKRHHLQARQDEAGNVWIEKPASPGYEQQPPLILQAHLDMVCEKLPEKNICFEKQAITPIFEKDMLRADGTTLGADNGIGLAMILAILQNKKQPHPPLTALFTVDEETGMIGAQALDVSPLHAARLFNLDSEEEGILTVGCAGGLRMDCFLPVIPEPSEGCAVTVSVDHLTGGHSGVDIHKGRANANRLLIETLHRLTADFSYRLAVLSGGTVDNAIPIQASATVILSAEETAAFCAQIAQIEEEYRVRYMPTDPALALTVTVGDVIRRAAVNPIPALDWLLALPNGVQEMSEQFSEKPETSLNLGVISMSNDKICASFALRGFHDVSIARLKQKLEHLTADAGGESYSYNGYPAWSPQTQSPLLDTAVAVFKREYGYPPQTDAIHAGLECGIFCNKLPALSCISFGPDIRDAHTPAETVSLSSIDRVYRYLCALLCEK